MVTGGTRGIGRSIAESFLKAGAQVAVCGRSAVTGEDIPSVRRTAGDVRSAVAFVADVRDAQQASSLVTQTVEAFGRLDVLVNNAGGSPEVLVSDASPRFLASIVSLNLLAPLYCAKAANALMQEQVTGGSIINISSVSGIRPSPGTAAYGASKAGLINLTQSLAIEWAPKVRINCVSAGMVATQAADDHYGGDSKMAAIAATVPLGRFGRPEDISDICLFLASPLAGYVTGTNLVAHGGGEAPAFLAAARSH